MYRKPREAPEPSDEYKTQQRGAEALKLTDQYIALLILVFTNAGLLDVRGVFFSNAFWLKLSQALTAILEERTTGSNLTRKAILLMAEVMQMANRVLPLNMAANIQVSYLATEKPLQSNIHG